MEIETAEITKYFYEIVDVEEANNVEDHSKEMAMPQVESQETKGSCWGVLRREPFWD